MTNFFPLGFELCSDVQMFKVVFYFVKLNRIRYLPRKEKENICIETYTLHPA